jgi:preprotein translocase subunit SecE
MTKIRIFISEVRSELAKASWPWDPKEHGFKRYRELADSTMVVTVAMLLLAGYISFCDFCLNTIVGALTTGTIGH